jgi:hypothetical protein
MRPFLPPSTQDDAVTQTRNLYHKLDELRAVALKNRLEPDATLPQAVAAINEILRALSSITADQGGRRT